MARVCIKGLFFTLVVLLASCGSMAAARETGPVLIGLYADLSSTGARDGNDALKGAQMQVREVNSSGGINGRPVQLRVLDMKQNPTDAVKAYIALAQDDGVCAVIGSAVTNAGLAVSPVADLVKVPLVFLGIDDRVTTPEMNPDKPEESGPLRPYSFMIQPSAAQIASSMASYAVEHFPMVRAAILYDPSDPVSSIQELSFASVVRKAGKIVAGSTELPPGGADYTTPLSKIRELGVDVVFVCGSAEENAAAAVKARDMGLRPALLGSQSWYMPPGGKLNPAGNGAWFCMGVSPDDRALVDLGERFKAQFGELPRPAVLPGWDAAALIVAAVRRAGSSNPQKVREALEQTKRFDSLRGPLDMDRKTHRLVGVPVAIMRIVEGRSITVEARYVPRAGRDSGQP